MSNLMPHDSAADNRNPEADGSQGSASEEDSNENSGANSRDEEDRDRPQSQSHSQGQARNPADVRETTQDEDEDSRPQEQEEQNESPAGERVAMEARFANVQAEEEGVPVGGEKNLSDLNVAIPEESNEEDDESEESEESEESGDESGSSCSKSQPRFYPAARRSAEKENIYGSGNKQRPTNFAMERPKTAYNPRCCPEGRVPFPLRDSNVRPMTAARTKSTIFA